MPTVTYPDKQTNTKITINYEVLGNNKPTIIFHHGNGNRIEDWHTLGYVDALKDDFQLILIDSRGYGKSSKPHDPKEYSLKSRADDTIAVLNQEVINTAHCLGGSIGAAMCAILAKFYPERFRSYIFSTPYFTLFNDDLKIALTKGIQSFMETLEKMLGDRFTNPAVRESILANDPKALWAANSSDWFNYRDFISYIKVPSLVYVGAKEPSVQELREFSSRLNQSRSKSLLHIFPDVDHAEVYWDGKMVAPIIKQFVLSVDY